MLTAKPRFPGDSFVDMLVQIGPMDSTHYSISQLLAIRGSKLQTSLERKLLDESKNNTVLTDILRQKHLGRNRRLPFLPRNNMELRKSFSTESEGHDQIKSQAPQTTAPVRDKAARQTVRHTVGDVSQLDGQAGRQLDGQDAEPDIPPEAPQRPVLPDQKRKGFEQFYEAVRSPTHVRVTAGGRIVPNTLEPSHSSPTGKGNRERLVGDVNGAQLPLGQTFNGNPFLPGPPFMGPMHPTMHSAFSMMTTGPSPMPPFGGFAMPPFALPQIPSQTAFSHPTSVGNPAGNLEDNKEHENSAVPTSAPLPMPPLGGQWFVPPHSMMPMGMPFPGGPMMPMAFSPMGQPMLYPQPLQPVPTPGARSFSPAVQNEGCPASSIRPSIITKNQLAGLRSSLKKAEAQLAYNRHQIDEKHMEEYARQLRSDIEHFEIKLKGELALEDNTLPQRNDTKDKSDSNVSKAPKFATDSRKTLLSSTVDAESINETVGNAPAKTITEEQKASKSRKRDRVRLAVDTSMASAPFINSNIFATISPVPFDPTGQQQQQESDHVRKPSTGLPVSAARAPIFQPRLDPHRPSENTPPVSALMNGEQDTHGTRFHGPIPTNFEESRLLSSIAPPTPAHDMEEFSNFARDNAGLGLPYLIGEIPFGMDPSPDLKDYIYHRPLNQDEEMAKHLFWTNAPEHLRQKFPKFNGKDFYPVSPEKMPRPSIISSHLPTGRPEQDFGFTLPTVDLDPFAPLEPYRGNLLRKPTLKEKEPKDMKRDTKSDNVTSPMKRRSKLRPVAYFNSQGLDESKQSSGSSENVETDSERAYFNSCVRTWSERVTAAATALPGAVTSENALGYLPQYAIGHAAASLSPAIAKAANQSK
ncbi:uncharacterized protein LY79DRAFT_513898 [Colletotrichum navitas]|uniref:Uncharacterized protein n=1 Tax=Colletotrichum navitas TaxID=681940 RepID=A0AAD8Q2C7_9PEZI|nr:uncharacterized protein LY79DRAFT_513898 [Colletotrichum navitas]KAK1593594.1 hypothetical protein LY79DRAFT_513898 [Colletotrichum navitas]